jgi:hypothetical protein
MGYVPSKRLEVITYGGVTSHKNGDFKLQYTSQNPSRGQFLKTALDR